jgi:OOP family OmpA-OmpF porin
MAQPKLDDIATALNNNPQVDNIVVTGYTDRIGSEVQPEAVRAACRRGEGLFGRQGRQRKPSERCRQGQGESDRGLYANQALRLDRLPGAESPRRGRTDHHRATRELI